MRLIKKIKENQAKILNFSILTFCCLALVINPVFAQAPTEPEEGNIGTIEDIYQTFIEIMRWILSFALVLAVILIIWAGVTYMTAGGDETSIGNAKKRFLYGVVGVIIVIAAFAIVVAIGRFLGVEVTIF